MTIIFRTAGAWGAGKGANLTPAEVDENFYELKTAVDDLNEQFIPVVNIDYFSVADNALFVHMTDHSVLGPYPIPMVGLWTFRDEWLPSTPYFVNDMFTADNVLYLVLIDHTSAGTFDPNATNGLGDNYYAVVLEAAPAIIETWNFQGVWEPLTVYAKFDVVTVDSAIYLVLQNHESDTTFDPNATNINGPLYSLIIDLAAASGIPAGGLTGQALVKHSDADYDVTWANVSGLPEGGASGQFLGKASSADFDVDWFTPPVSIPAGGAAGYVLAKHSSTDYDTEWIVPPDQASKWYAGSGVPTTTFNDQDLYLNTANGDVYQQLSGSWALIGNIRGTTGAAGSNGLNGSTWYSGSGAPVTLHANGDFYIDFTTGDYYRQTSGAWGSPVGNIGSINLNALTDVTITSPATKQVIRYNGSAWVNALPLLTDDSDVLIASVANGQVLTYDSTSGKWKNATPSSGAGLPTGGTAGQVLTKASGTDYDADWETPSAGSTSFWPQNGGSFTDPPAIAGWTSFGSGVTAEDWTAGDTSGVRIRGNTSGSGSIVGIYKTQSFASNFTIIAGFRIRPFMHPTNSGLNGGGLLFMTSGHTSGVFFGQYSKAGIGRIKFTSLTSVSEGASVYSDLDSNNRAENYIPLEFWIKAVWNQSAGTLTFYWSSDGNYWSFGQSYNPSAVDSFTFTDIGMAMNQDGAGLGSLERILDMGHLSIA